MQNKSLNCPFCKKQHNVKLNENQFFEYDCDEFGYIFISKRAVTEFERHPSRIDLTKIKAIECKQKKVC